MSNSARSEKPRETLAGAAEMVMAMDAEQFQQFEPRTVAEQTAALLAHKMMRGSEAAFNQLREIADSEEQSFVWVEDVLVKIRECAFAAGNDDSRGDDDSE